MIEARTLKVGNVRVTIEELVDKQESGAADASGFRPCTREFAEAHPEESEWMVRGINVWCPMRFFTGEPYHYEFRSRFPQADEPVAIGTPGTIISWQEAQRRVDVGLPVECSLNSVSWHPVNRVTHSCGNLYCYRIPLATPAQPEEVKAEMTAEEAELYLGDCLKHRVIDDEGDAWQAVGTGGFAYLDSDSGEKMFQRHLPQTGYRFTKLLPATRTQVALMAEVERLKKELRDGEKYAADWRAKFEYEDSVGRALRVTCESFKQQLRAMTGSRDAAVAALEQERARALALTELLQEFHSVLLQVPNTTGTARAIKRALNETERKAE